MDYLLDTNVLLRVVHRADPNHVIARTAVRKLSRGGRLKTSTQNLIEFWNVSTRPVGANGFGLTPQVVEKRLRLLERLFPLAPDSPAVYAEWRRLVVSYNVSGVHVHDAKLVAVMLVHQINQIVTFDFTDFKRYAPEGIVALDPASV